MGQRLRDLVKDKLLGVLVDYGGGERRCGHQNGCPKCGDVELRDVGDVFCNVPCSGLETGLCLLRVCGWDVSELVLRILRPSRKGHHRIPGGEFLVPGDRAFDGHV